ncbi:MAG TPA: outer membrane beta-barrel protein [Gammaproteobacteria bacterium]
MRNTALKLVVCLGLWLTVQATALAANEGWYGGFNMGSAEVEVIDESDLGYKFYGGYLSKFFGAELGFYGLGDGYTVDNVDVYGMSFEFVGRVPVSAKFSLLGRFGLFWWTVENCYDAYYYYYCEGGTYDDGDDLTYGVGVEFDVTDHVSIRGEWQEFTDVSGSDVSLLSAGIVYTFLSSGNW